MTDVALEPTEPPSLDRSVEPTLREIRYEHSLNLGPILERFGVTLLVSTYQAGKLGVIGRDGDRLNLSFHNFERAMGVAASGDRIAVGSTSQVWFLQSALEIAARVEPAGRHDACYLTRSSHVTGEIQVHEMAWATDELWLVNTAFSCLCTLDRKHSFVPRWRPPYISSLAAEDRCHLNGLAMDQGRPRYVTAMSETDAPQGWRPGKATGGCLIDVPSGATIARGFAMPHSPRIHQGRVWLLDSGRGQLVTVDPQSGHVERVCELPGYARGLAMIGTVAFIGLSKIRETSTFGGVPVADHRDELKCGVAVVELTSARQVALLEFHSGVEEIFDVQILPGIRNPLVSGPYPAREGHQVIWLVPEPPATAPPRKGDANLF
jgi:uncharacterized protein (TIGR03032 family)